MIEDRRPHRFRNFRWMHAVAGRMVRMGFTPNQVSLAGIAFSLAGFACLWASGNWFMGWVLAGPAALCVLLRLICNALDTLMLLQMEGSEKARPLFKDVSERVEDMLLLAGCGFAAKLPELGWACALLALGTAHIRVLGAALGFEEDFAGLCAQPARMYVILAALPIAGVAEFLFFSMHIVMLGALGAIGLGTAYTLLLRVRRLYRRITTEPAQPASRITLKKSEKSLS